MCVFENPFISVTFQVVLLPFVLLLLICFLVAKATQHKQSRLFSFCFVYFDCFYLVKHQKGSQMTLTQQSTQCTCVTTAATIIVCCTSVNCCLVYCSVLLFAFSFFFLFWDVSTSLKSFFYNIDFQFTIQQLNSKFRC